MIHCQMNYSDNKYCRSSGEGVLTLGWDAQVHDDKCELVLRLDQWVNFRWEWVRGKNTLRICHSITRMEWLEFQASFFFSTRPQKNKQNNKFLEEWLASAERRLRKLFEEIWWLGKRLGSIGYGEEGCLVSHIIWSSYRGQHRKLSKDSRYN